MAMKKIVVATITSIKVKAQERVSVLERARLGRSLALP
jgi:hypothetical protein